MVTDRAVERLVRRLEARAKAIERNPGIRAYHWRALTFRQAAAMVAALLPATHPMRQSPRRHRHGS